MGWTEIAILLIQNAPSIISTAEDGLAWAADTWSKIKESYDQPADTITKEQLLEQLARIQANSDEIQGLD